MNDKLNENESIEEKTRFSENEEAKEIVEIQELKLQIELLEEKNKKVLAQSHNQYKNLLATTEEEKKVANKRIIIWVLGFLDSMDRTIQSIKENSGNSGSNLKTEWVETIEGVRDSLVEGLVNEGVREIEVKLNEDKFDSKYHESIGIEENDDFPSDTVLRIVSKGFMLHDKVIKVCRVIISKRNSGRSLEKAANNVN